MNPSGIRLLAAFLAMYSIAGAQLFETTLQRLDRESSARQWANARDEMQRQIDAFNTEITAARAKFWATYPDKPGAPEAQKRFFDLLYDKDQFYVTSALSNRMSTGGDPGDSLDGGIRSTARPEFDDFIAAARPGIAMMSGDMMKMMQTVWAATDRHPDEFRAYRLERDWWEFDQMHRIPAPWDKPERYAAYLYARYYKISISDAEKSNAAMMELLGRDVVTAAARKVIDAPKSDKGNMVLTAPRPVKVGPGGSEVEDSSVPEPANPIGAYPSPILTFGKLISQDDDRRYLLYLLTSQHRIDSTTVDRVNQWPWAAGSYARLVAAFSEKEVLEAAHKVRTAKKAYVGSRVLDPDAIGSTRAVPFNAFEEILVRKNPRGYVRAALAFSRSLDSVKAIDTAYQTIVAGQEEAYLTAARRRAKDRPNVTSSSEFRSMENLLGAAPEVEKPPEEMVDYPVYLDWKKYPVGSQVTYVERKWMASRPRPGSYVSDNPTVLVAYPPEARNSYLLKSIDDKKASLWFTQASANVYGQMHPASDSEISYPARYQKSVADRSARLAADAKNGPTPTSTLVWNAQRTADPVESGDEIVEVKGHRIATHWEAARYTAPDFNNESGVSLVVKVWTSHDVPTGLVRRTEDKRVQRIPGQLQPARYIVETYLESFEGFTPPTASGSGAVMTTYAPPPLDKAIPVVGGAASATRAPAPGNPPATTAPVQTTPVRPQPTPRTPAPPAVDTSNMPPEVARQVEISQKYSAAAARATRARNQLMQWQQVHGASSVPAKVAAARDQIPAQLQALVLAIARNSAQTGSAFQTLDASSALIEEFLAH